MKKILTIVAMAFWMNAAHAQGLEIVNQRICPIRVNVSLNGPCFGTGSCDWLPGGSFTIDVAPGTTVYYPTVGLASSGAITCAPMTYEYVRFGLQNHNCDVDCWGVGVTVGDPCTGLATGFGPTCYVVTPPQVCVYTTYCAVMSRPFGPGSARLVAY